LVGALQGFYVFIRALQLLRSHNEGVVLVGLGGASGSGKTAFSEKVRGTRQQQQQEC
jgi:Ni2+-binding GTPase involved in maturation of urease and hydrogenase